MISWVRPAEDRCRWTSSTPGLKCVLPALAIGCPRWRGKDGRSSWNSLTTYCTMEHSHKGKIWLGTEKLLVLFVKLTSDFIEPENCAMALEYLVTGQQGLPKVSCLRLMVGPLTLKMSNLTWCINIGSQIFFYSLCLSGYQKLHYEFLIIWSVTKLFRIPKNTVKACLDI